MELVPPPPPPPSLNPPDPAAHVGPDGARAAAAATHLAEAIGASVLVSQGGAHPRLGVGDSPRYLHPNQGLQAPQLGGGPTHLVGGVAQLLDAVTQRRRLAPGS
ncbi:hypothetical protein B296_00016191, partial [Ensete ventricosum]